MTAMRIEQAGCPDHERVVTVRRRGQRLQIAPPCMAVMAALQTAVRSVEATAPHGYKIVTKRTPLFALETECGQPVLRFPAGLEPAVRRILTDTGCTIRDVGYVKAQLPSTAVDALKKLTPIDTPLLEYVQCRERGTIRIDPANVKPARLVEQISLAWPYHTITVVVSRRADANHLAGELRKLVGGVSVISGQANPAVVERVVVSTYKGLGHGAMYKGEKCKAFDHSWLNIVIALDAMEATGSEPMKCLLACHRARLYGFLARHPKPAPLAADMMAAWQRSSVSRSLTFLPTATANGQSKLSSCPSSAAACRSSRTPWP